MKLAVNNISENCSQGFGSLPIETAESLRLCPRSGFGLVVTFQFDAALY
jgi:hypothetical protein